MFDRKVVDDHLNTLGAAHRRVGAVLVDKLQRRLDNT
jgi:hypothetical protein